MSVKIASRDFNFLFHNDTISSFSRIETKNPAQIKVASRDFDSFLNTIKVASRDFDSFFLETIKVASHDFDSLAFEKISPIKKAIKQRNSSKIRYRSSSSYRIFIERRAARQNRSTLTMNISEINVNNFARLERKKDHETFILFLKEIDLFLERLRIELEIKFELTSYHSQTNLTNLKIIYRLDSRFSFSEKEIHLTLFHMNRALTLRTSVIIEELDVYRENKNVDLVSLLLRQYHEFLNVFFKKNVDSFLEHRLYDHVIKLKDDFSTLS
jgi:hypothetical protein